MEKLERKLPFKINIDEQHPLSIKTNFVKFEMFPDRYPDKYYLPSSRVFKTPSFEMPEDRLGLFKKLEDNNEIKPPQQNNPKPRSGNRKCRPRNSARYMTQPITLIEIKEIEEDTSSSNVNAESNNKNNENAAIDKGHMLKKGLSFNDSK